MSFDTPPENKMMTEPPGKKGWHFASDGIHKAAYILAETIEQATALYHKTKELLKPASAETPTSEPAPQSTASAEQKGGDVQ